MPISLPDIVRITNAEQSGIVLATEVSGARCVATLNDLYAIADPILSPSRNNTNNDALGQEWYVVSENASYKLVDWNNRKSSAGWESILSAATWSSVVATGKNEEVGVIPTGGTRQLKSSSGGNIALFKEDNVQLSYVNGSGSDFNALDIRDEGIRLQSTSINANGSDIKARGLEIIDRGVTLQSSNQNGSDTKAGYLNITDQGIGLQFIIDNDSGIKGSLLNISDQGIGLLSIDETGSETYSFRVSDDEIAFRGTYINFYNEAGNLTFPIQNSTVNAGDSLGDLTVFQFGSTTQKTAISMVSDRYLEFTVPTQSAEEESYIQFHVGESSTGNFAELLIGDGSIIFTGAPVQGEDAVDAKHFITKRQLTWANVTTVNTPSIGKLGDVGYLQVMNGRDTIFQVNKSVSYLENRVTNSSITTLLSGRIIRNNGGSAISEGAALRWWNGTDVSSNIIISASSSGAYVDGAPLQIVSGTESNHAVSYGQLTEHAKDFSHVKVEDESSAAATFASGTRSSNFNGLNGILLTPSEMEGYPADAYKCTITKVGVLSRGSGGSFTSTTLYAHLWRWLGGTNFEYVTASTNSDSWTALNQVAEWEFDNVEIFTGNGFLITWSTSRSKPASYSSSAQAVNLAVGNTDSAGLTVVYGTGFRSDLQAITTVTATYYVAGSLSAYGIPIASGSQSPDRYVATNPELVVANGEANWEVNHNLGTQDVIVQVVEVATNRVAYVGITLNSVNLVTVSLTSDVNIAPGTYKVIVK